VVPVGARKRIVSPISCSRRCNRPSWLRRTGNPGLPIISFCPSRTLPRFSPTDVLPLSRWAKMTMMLQAAVSLSTVALVVARAVNVLK
jgi:hypothetical protein